MAKPTIKLVKKSMFKAAAKPAAGAAVVNYLLTDGEDGSFSVMGADSAGQPIDISTVATLTPVPTTTDAAILSVDPPVGMGFTVHGLKPSVPGTPILVGVTATWNDPAIAPPGSPFHFNYPCTVTTGPVGGLIVTAGPPVARP